MRVLKFGGSSVADAERIRRVADVVAAAAGAEPRRVVVVVSALGGVTDELAGAVRRATADHDGAGAVLAALETRHDGVLRSVLAPEERAEASAGVAAAFDELREIVRGVSLVGECTARTLDKAIGFGERLSAVLVAGALRRAGLDAEACDARRLIRTDRRFGSARVDEPATDAAIRAHFTASRPLQVVTGFIASSAEGETTTLGRGGSDLTAALLARALRAEAIELWTDVDGVMSADPRLVPEAFSLPCLSFEELMELSHFGAKVVYPPTVQPARQAGIELWIKNTLDPSFPGTRIVETRPAELPAAGPITGISSVHRVTLMRLEGDGMVGVPGMARRLFDALAREQISVILITQASSEHSISFAVEPAAGKRARQSVESEFALERRAGVLRDLVVEDDQCIVAVVGEGMRERPGLAGRVFGLLGDRGINVRAIAQGSSELNISLVLARGDERRAVRAIHDAFFARPRRALDVVVAGVGGVGSTLLRQLARRADRLAGEVSLAGVLDSRHMLIDGDGLDPDPGGDPADARRAWRERLAAAGQALDLERLAAWLEERPGERVLVDVTASEAVPALYGRLRRAGIGIVSANKLPFAAPLERARELYGGDGAPLCHETTVGAGLPVLQTIESLLATGDRMIRVQGLFSGTLGYLLTRMAAGQPFSAALRDAHRLGYTEPDPREDLSGADVMRKLLILARTAGLELEPEEIDVEPFVDTTALDGLPLERFWAACERHDDPFRRLLEEARAAERRLCYLASLEGDATRVGLEALPLDHPCATVSGTDNLFALTTERYRDQPLVIRGPGAGTDVTAAGVFADLLRARNQLAAARRTGGGP